MTVCSAGTPALDALQRDFGQTISIRTDYPMQNESQRPQLGLADGQKPERPLSPSALRLIRNRLLGYCRPNTETVSEYVQPVTVYVLLQD
jgi:hypothetical protein